jgi:hypothetical protein
MAEDVGIEPTRGANPITVFKTDKHAGLAVFQINRAGWLIQSSVKAYAISAKIGLQCRI